MNFDTFGAVMTSIFNITFHLGFNNNLSAYGFCYVMSTLYDAFFLVREFIFYITLFSSSFIIEGVTL